MKKPAAVVALLAGGVAAGVALASSAPSDAPALSDLGQAARQSPGAARQSDMDLRRWPLDGFHRELTRRIDALSSAHGPERLAVFLDMAELYLSQALLYEAGSVLDGVEPEAAGDARRWRAMRDAALLLSGQPASEDIKTSPLAALSRPDRSLWLTLQAVAVGDSVMLRNNLAGALEALAYQTRPVVRVLLPILAEAAVETGEARLADQAVALLEGFPDLSSAPVGSYLRGRAALVQGRAKTALEHYFLASDGWDLYAARSRLALADMALKDGGRGALLAARDVLEYGVGAWRGDRYERELLRRLAGLYTATGDPLSALVARGKLMLRFPGTEAAEEAATLARADMASVYQDGAAGRLSLSKWVTLHMELVPLYRFFPEFAQHSEILADRALELGGTDLAAGEYRRALALVQELATVSGTTVDEGHLIGLRLKLARALSGGGQYAEARTVLERIGAPEDPAQRRRVNALKASVLASLGDNEGVLRTHVAAPDAGNLRDLALALWQEGTWTEATRFYTKLWVNFPDAFTARDASYLLLAARRAGDVRAASEVVAAFPDLTDSVAWVEIAESLLNPPAPLVPLSRDAADTRLESAKRAVGTINAADTGL
ncbi:hypothetical protein E1832_07335 [Antarcticimicrobium luteum]|uniref:Tetratricopeptide repeat protein n=2 Tax=Antarcticimicrobium luteum TaxID=2547397 RepID=A0A4R5VD44_9RHOB|nr:tetratricopeptide repeat protein [Antarcticimicrobium luteum]TDK50213.1 hypothetical protein E1832_07335 [Antarcticimicrobium luteum]